MFDCLVLGRQICSVLEPSQPISLMADAAGAITIGFQESALRERIYRRGMCWFHVKKATDQRLVVKDPNVRAKLIADMITMQLCQTPEIFEAESFFKPQWLDSN